MKVSFKKISINILIWIIVYLFIFTIGAAFVNFADSYFQKLFTWLFILVITLILMVPFYIAYFAYPFYFSKIKSKKYITISISLLFLYIYAKNTAIAVEANFLSAYILSFFVSLIFMFMGFSLRNLFEIFKNQEIRRELEEVKFKSEIAILKNTLNPHFFFNSLNLIDYLIFNEPKKASSVLIQLSDIFRYMIYDTDVELTSLEKEIEYLKKYVEIEKTRFANDMAIKFEVEGVAVGIQIAPMIFINFIENAFKHSSNLTSENAIQIYFKIENKRISFKSVNDYNPFINNSEINKVQGIGLKTVKKRLELLYPNKHMLKISKIDNKYLVEMWIETNDN